LSDGPDFDLFGATADDICLCRVPDGLDLV
jgi:hypothetical protein